MFRVIFLCLFSFPSLLFAQKDSAVKYALPDVKLYYVVNGRGVITDFDDPRNEFTLTRDTLYSGVKEYKFKTALTNLNKFCFMKTKINPAFVIPAFLIGCALGFGISGFSDAKGDRIFTSVGTGIVFAAITGLISVMFTPVETYDMTSYSAEQKWAKLKKLMRENKLK